MGTIISLSTPNLDWELLSRTVERTGLPLWLELDGALQGVLLPGSDVARLMGLYTQHREGGAESGAESSVPKQAC